MIISSLVPWLVLPHIILIDAFSPSSTLINNASNKSVFGLRKELSYIKTSIFSSAIEDDQLTLEGVSNFEKWFKEQTRSNDNKSMEFLRHEIFSNGRGLECIAKRDIVEDGKPIITLPKDLVLQSTMVSDKEKLESIIDDWDVSLTMQLLRECKLGENSVLYGYCSLLTRGQDFNAVKPCPPSTASDALRNWPDDEKEILTESKRGIRLLRIEEKQNKEWVEKYNALSSEDRGEFSFEQFQWAMEAVHSRAFKGDFTGQDPTKELSKTLVPFAAGAFALNYIRSGPFGSDDNITFLLLFLACAPVVLNFLSENVLGGKMDAVLLPFIDSANHRGNANSNIEFDPLKGAFTVSVEGSNCIIKDGDKQQFYISYGDKRDTELLLNYGFLNDFNSNYENQEERRRALAKTFNARSL